VCGSTINPGDLVIGNILAPGGPSNLVLVNPVNGSQVILSSAVSFPSGVAFAPNGGLFVTDLNADAILQIDPATGSPHTISSGGSLVRPLGLAIGASGDLFALNGLTGSGAALLRVNAQTGTQTVVSSGGLFSEPIRVVFDQDGAILVTDGSFTSRSKIIRVDPTTGIQTVVSSGGNLFSPAGISVNGQGEILVADSFVGIVRIDAMTGFQSLLSSGGANGIAVATDGDVFITVPGGVYSVDATTGVRSPVSIGGNFSFVPVDIAISPQLTPIPEPTTLLLVGTTMAGLGLAAWRRRRHS